VKKKEGSVRRALDKIEGELDRNNKQLERINSRLESILLDLQEMEQKAGSLDSSLRERETRFKERARALYKWHRGGSPFVLLNGAFSIADIIRRKRYLELMLAKDRDLIQSLIEAFAQQGSLQEQLSKRRNVLDKERMALVRVKESIGSERNKKRMLLARLSRGKGLRQRALKELEEAARELQRMVDGISSKSSTQSVREYRGKGFAAVKGRLDYPVPGKVITGYGKVKHPEFSDELFRKGIDIEAPYGEEIRAVEEGKLIFSDRVSGYGKMIIIDHGDRYYTIYAHLSRLLKRTGETVRRSEPIALAGDTGSIKGSRLYFEIRKDGKPINPILWFKNR
jgi:septal ring factor EnvC (AmiA/AmiB activator)